MLNIRSWFWNLFRLSVTVKVSVDVIDVDYYGDHFTFSWPDIKNPKLISSKEHGVSGHYVEFNVGPKVLSFSDEHIGFYGLVEWMRIKANLNKEDISKVLASEEACIFLNSTQL